MRTLLLLSLLASVGQVQPVAPAVLSADERLMVESVLLLKKQALLACAEMPAMKEYQSLQARVEARLKQAHPAQTFDWSTGKLVAK